MPATPSRRRLSAHHRRVVARGLMGGSAGMFFAAISLAVLRGLQLLPPTVETAVRTMSAWLFVTSVAMLYPLAWLFYLAVGDMERTLRERAGDRR